MNPRIPTPAQRWARERNFYLFKLEGTKGILNVPEYLRNDETLCELASCADAAIKEMLARIRQFHSSYKTRIKEE